MEPNKKRTNPYTSTSIGKDKVHLLTELQKHAKSQHGKYITHQSIIDLAVQIAADDRDAFIKRLLDEDDPRMKAYLKLQAELKAAGKL
jgi:hypothetical protein